MLALISPVTLKRLDIRGHNLLGISVGLFAWKTGMLWTLTGKHGPGKIPKIFWLEAGEPCLVTLSIFEKHIL